MRLKPSASFPHPVLADSTGDYRAGTFQLNMVVREDPKSGHAMLEGVLSLDEPSISTLLAEGRAKSGLMLTCRDTYLSTFKEVLPGSVQIELSGGVVRGPVVIRGVILAARDGLVLDSGGINPEFPEEARVVKAGDVIALTEELRFEAGLEKLAPLESIFRLKSNEDIADGTFRIDLESEAIEILVSPRLHAFVSLLREQSTRDILLSSLFLPVLMSVLDAMRGDEGYVARRWHRAVTARCTAAGVDVKTGDIAEVAQKLLDAPLGALQRAVERFSA